MKKLDRNYLSFYEAIGLVDLINPKPRQPVGYSYHGYRYHDGSYIYKPHKSKVEILGVHPVYFGFQILGSFKPFAKMGKDFLDTFRPYYTVKKFVHDLLLQPFHGLFNILKGAGSLVGGILLLAGWTVIAPFALLGCLIPVVNVLYAFPFLKKLAYPLSWAIEGVANIFRGVTQIISTPLMLPRLAVRGVLNAISYYRGDKFLAEEKPEIQRLANEALVKLQQVNEYENPFDDNTFGENTEAFILRHLNNNADKDKHEVAVYLHERYKKGEVFKQDFVEYMLDEINAPVIQARRDVPVLMFEVNRKYVKSVNNGWDTNCGSNDSMNHPFFKSNDLAPLQ